LRVPRIGLVLGAGGVVGQAYHAGVLAALEHDLGWDPRTADVIVGSSAGSVTGSLLRLGVGASDLAAWAVEAPLSVEAEPMLERLGGRDAADADFPKPSPLDLFRPWRLPSAALLRRTAARPWAFRPGASAMTLLPAGRIDIAEKAEVLHAISGDAWPEGLWICAARRRDGGRVVFGRPGAPYAPLGRAVAASCAIPGYFSPVRIGNVSYFDGGVYSPTNADVLRDEKLDLVVVVSPMSSAGGVARSADAPLRFLAHRKLEREIGRLRSKGTPVVAFEPGARSIPVMGLNAMATDRADRVVQAAFLEAGRRAATGRAADRLRPLVSRPGRLRPAAP
jgi:NTE family protein